MLYKHTKEYIKDLNNLAIPGDEKIEFPVNFDTEFQNPYFHKRISDEKINIAGRELIWPADKYSRLPITCQISTLDDKHSKIYAYNEFSTFNKLNNLGNIRHEILPVDTFIPLEFLSSITDFNYLLSDGKNKYGKSLTVTVVGFFLTAEISLLCTGNMRKEIVRIINNKDLKGGKRLSTGNQLTDTVKTNFVANWKGFKYNINLKLMDLGAIHGDISYYNLAKNVGHDLKYKDNFETIDKENMVITYFEKPKQFDEYALGDLETYQIYLKNADLKKRIYKDLNIESFFEPPRLTIGSEVSKLLEAVFLNHFNLNIENYKHSKVYSYIINKTNFENLRFKTFKNKFFEIFGETNTDILSNRLDTGCYLAKVIGGRCYNNRNNERNIKSIMLDLDIAGCYGNGLMNQDYPLGYPKFITNPLYRNCEKIYLKDFLQRYENELIPGLWMCVISTVEPLTYEQDFFPSWIDFKFENNQLKVKSGITKIFQKVIKNSVLTSDGLDFIMYVLSNKQRNDFFTKVVIESAVFYPKSSKLNSLEELVEKPVDDCNWISVNLGDIVIRKLLSERKKYPKTHSLNKQFKLMINTSYGDIVSPYFNISNSLVGNNITARARALCYYMEKGLNGFQSITDGVCFEVEKVLFPMRNKYLNGIDLTNHKNRKYGKLFDADDLVKNFLYLKNNPELENEKNEFDSYINSKCFEHLKKIFHHEIRIFKNNQFKFEYKDILKEASFMGSSDYKFTFLDDSVKIKKRSYNERKMIYKVEKVHPKWIELDMYPDGNIPLKIMNDLKSNMLEINPPGLQYQILKVSEYKNNRAKYEILGLLPGDNINRIVVPKPISISQIKYNNPEDYNKMKKINDKLIRKNFMGIGSIFYRNFKVKFIPEFFNNPFEFIKDVNVINPFYELINMVKKHNESLLVVDHTDGEILENFDFFGEFDDDYYNDDLEVLEDIDLDIDF